MAKRAAVIFDLDGTLLNTLDDLTDAVNATMRRFGFPEKTTEEVRLAVGNGADKLIERTLPNGAATEGFGDILRWYREYYSLHSAVKTAPYPGIVELLDALRERGCLTAVVSNKQDDAVKLLCRQYFGDRISAAIGESATVRKKPAPDSLFAAMRIIGANLEDCVYVGDSDVDIETAKNADIPCISVSWGFRSEVFLAQHGAKSIVSSPELLFDRLTQFFF